MFQLASARNSAAYNEALEIADDLAGQFHSHAIEIEEIVYHMRPDMSALLPGRYSKESVQDVWDNYKGLSRKG
jgi:hypothetical protein